MASLRLNSRKNTVEIAVIASRHLQLFRIDRGNTVGKHCPVHGKILINQRVHGRDTVIYQNFTIHINLHIHKRRELSDRIETSGLDRISLLYQIGG